MTVHQAVPIEKQVLAHGLEVFYLEAGQGPDLVLLHGGTSTSSSWSEQLSVFARHFHVVAPDSRGHGRTDNPDGVLSYPAMADDVAALLTELGLEKPLVVGYSDGGQIALELGMRHPEMPAALVLGGASCAFGPGYFAELRAMGFPSPGEVDVDVMRSPEFDWPELLRRQHVRAGQPDHWLTVLHQISHLWYSVRDYSSEELASVSVPTLVFVGDRDAMNPLDGTLSMHRGLPGSALMVVPDADHLGAAAELTNPVVLDFLRRHASQPAS